jgi:phosphatidylglycerophosphate synthase
LIDTALIRVPSRADELIFGRPLLERLILMCERAGVKRFFVERPADGDLGTALGGFRDSPKVALVDSLSEVLDHRFGLAGEQPCLALSGNLVFARSQLNRAMAQYAAAPERVIKAPTDDGSGMLAAGPLAQLLGEISTRIAPAMSPGLLPYSLDGRPEDRREAELRLARAVRMETADKDGLFARLFDRKISWRISYRLARTAVTPNQVTIFNTALGLLTAWMFSIPSYWPRLGAALLFLAGITIDGVDGELARLKMTETEWGGKLDMVTDNIVHVALFIGLLAGCYRASGSSAYFYLLPILLGGFLSCAIVINRALNSTAAAKEWLATVDRITGRDFAYLLVLLAAINHLEYFAWGTAFGTYPFALAVWWLTKRNAG